MLGDNITRQKRRLTLLYNRLILPKNIVDTWKIYVWKIYVWHRIWSAPLFFTLKHSYIIYTRIIISMVHSRLFSCFFLSFIRPNNENENHSALDNCNQTATEKDWNAKSTFAYLQRWIVGIFVIFLLFFWYFYDLYRKNGMKADAHKHSTSYKRSTMILQPPQRVNVKKINNKCFERGMNTINCWNWQTSWCTKGITGCCCYSVLCVCHRLLIFFFLILFSASVFIHFSNSYFSMLYHSEPWMWIIYNRKKTNLYAEMLAFKCVAQIKAMNKGNGIFVIWTYRYAGRIQRSNGSFPHVNAKFICCFYFSYPPHPTSQSRSRILNNTNMYYCSIAFATNHQKKFILQIFNHNVSTKRSSEHKNKDDAEYLNKDTRHNLSKIECLDALDVGKLVLRYESVFRNEHNSLWIEMNTMSGCYEQIH